MISLHKHDDEEEASSEVEQQEQSPWSLIAQISAGAMTSSSSRTMAFPMHTIPGLVVQPTPLNIADIISTLESVLLLLDEDNFMNIEEDDHECLGTGTDHGEESSSWQNSGLYPTPEGKCYKDKEQQ
jgi:hypothetical protein